VLNLVQGISHSGVFADDLIGRTTNEQYSANKAVVNKNRNQPSRFSSEECNKIERNAVKSGRRTSYEAKEFDFCVSRSFSP
jgi:hypothetical protein